MPTPRKTTTTARKAPAKKAAASRSGNPAARAAAATPIRKAPSSAAGFKKKNEAQLIDLPSGETVLARRPGPTALISSGILGDRLTALAQKAIDTAEGTGKPVSDADRAAMAQDPEQVKEMMAAFDKVIVKCWLDPAVHLEPEQESDRDPDLLYTDEVDLEDKIFTFNWAAGGTADLERFRDEFSESLAGLSTE